jgi:hypothetical protein
MSNRETWSKRMGVAISGLCIWTGERERMMVQYEGRTDQICERWYHFYRFEVQKLIQEAVGYFS